MMNDKDLQRKMKEQMIALLDSYEKMAKKLAEEKENEFKLEKGSRSQKSRIEQIIYSIQHDESILDVLGFVGFNDGDGFVFGNMGNNTVDILSLMIADVFEQLMSDKADDVGFEDFLKNLADNARRARRGSRNNERN